MQDLSKCSPDTFESIDVSWTTTYGGTIDREHHKGDFSRQFRRADGEPYYLMVNDCSVQHLSECSPDMCESIDVSWSITYRGNKKLEHEVLSVDGEPQCLTGTDRTMLGLSECSPSTCGLIDVSWLITYRGTVNLEHHKCDVS